MAGCFLRLGVQPLRLRERSVQQCSLDSTPASAASENVIHVLGYSNRHERAAPQLSSLLTPIRLLLACTLASFAPSLVLHSTTAALLHQLAAYYGLLYFYSPLLLLPP